MKRYVTVERALRTAAPHRLLDALRAALTEQYGAASVELLMADYGLTVLQPVTALPCTGEPVPVHGSAPGRAFGAQEPFVERRGERTIAERGDVDGGDEKGVGGDRVERRSARRRRLPHRREHEPHDGGDENHGQNQRISLSGRHGFALGTTMRSKRIHPC